MEWHKSESLHRYSTHLNACKCTQSLQYSPEFSFMSFQSARFRLIHPNQPFKNHFHFCSGVGLTSFKKHKHYDIKVSFQILNILLEVHSCNISSKNVANCYNLCKFLLCNFCIIYKMNLPLGSYI